MFNVSIPKISDKEMLKRYKHIKPVITLNGKLYYFREFTLEEINGISYLWNSDKDVRGEVGKNELEVWKDHDFVCLHRYGHPIYFKPSIGEILSQIPECDIPYVRAFEIINSPQISDDFYADSFTTIAFNNGYHVSIVRLYVSKM